MMLIYLGSRDGRGSRGSGDYGRRDGGDSGPSTNSRWR